MIIDKFFMSFCPKTIEIPPVHTRFMRGRGGQLEKGSRDQDRGKEFFKLVIEATDHVACETDPLSWCRL